MDNKDDNQQGKLSTSASSDIVERVHQLLTTNRQIKVEEMSVGLGIWQESVQYIISERNTTMAKYLRTTIGSFTKDLLPKFVWEHHPYSPERVPCDFQVFNHRAACEARI